MNSKNTFLMSAIFLAMLMSSMQRGSYLLQWWSGYVSKIWNSIWGAISGFLGLNPAAAISVQQQFANQLSGMQNKTQNFTRFYLSNAQLYVQQYGKRSNFSLNQSWSIQITDRNSTNSAVIGSMTVTWLGPSRGMRIQRGLVSYNVSPTYAVTATHKAFMALSGDAIAIDTLSALADYLSYNASGAVKYSRIR